MNTAKYVDQMVNQWKAEGKSKPDIVWNAALHCVGWPYVYSAWGAECTPAERRKRYRMCPEHEAIKTKCKGFDSGVCSGCQWFPGGERVRCFDCRGFTDWTLNRVGIDLYGDTCGVQWNHKANWDGQGTIDTMPKDRLCCLFVKKNGKFTHTGLGLNNEVCDCGNNVSYTASRPKKWTHWALPKGLYDGQPIPDPSEDQGIGEPAYIDKRPLLQRGSKNKYVKLLQETLISLGYNLGICGADGDFGTMTLDAVLRFQREHGLKADGIVGPATYAALDKAAAGKQTETPSEKTYSVIIRGLDYTQASAVANNYPGAEIVEGSVAK